MEKLKKILLLFSSVIILSLIGLVVINLIDIIVDFSDIDIIYITNLTEKYIVYAITYLSAVIIISTYLVISTIKKN